MKSSLKTLFLVLATFSFIEANTNCAAAVVVAFIPLIAASQWVNPAVANKANTFFFNVTTPNSNTSTFDGNENLAAGGQSHFTGSFTNHDLQLVYDNSGSVAKKGSYKGYVNDASTQITLASSDGLPPITLNK